ncbi:hypothetical protein D3C83_65810 [compost metagenome]
MAVVTVRELDQEGCGEDAHRVAAVTEGSEEQGFVVAGQAVLPRFEKFVACFGALVRPGAGDQVSGVLRVGAAQPL